jgi:hypothetical protein
MTINNFVFTDWGRRTDWLAPQYERPSPNLVAILNYLRDRWGGVSLGIHYNRNIRNGQTPSAHAFGAALDWRWAFHQDYPTAQFITRDQLDREVIPFLVDNSLELGIQAIHDEGRIWRSDRPGTEFDATWKAQFTGYSGWLHIETTEQAFANITPVTARFSVNTLPPFDPVNGKFGLWPLNASKPRLSVTSPRMRGDATKYVQGVIFHRAGGNITIDGIYGPQTSGRVRDLQRFLRTGGVEGVVGPEVWRLIDHLATR